jgi:hypothetical protein
MVEYRQCVRQVNSRLKLEEVGVRAYALYFLNSAIVNAHLHLHWAEAPSYMHKCLEPLVSLLWCRTPIILIPCSLVFADVDPNLSVCAHAASKEAPVWCSSLHVVWEQLW